MDPEISGEVEKDIDSDLKPYQPKEIKIKPKRKLTWRKAGLAFLFVLVSAAVFASGYLAVILWQRYFPDSFLTGPNPYENWLVYRSEAYELGLRYPDNWEVEEVNSDFAVFRQKAQTEGEVLPKDYVSLTMAANALRGKTACENDQSACSFHANGIFGDRITTPESETIFFSKGENDFTLAWAKYGEASYAAIFEEMGKSLRFITPEESDVQNP
ncbi:hypothetical protein A2890_01010 [candidate division WWE3 bacterium RIFCSPLOWO2_01_FULL_53_14]|uniref:Uncharacterized protein n=1 Tax=candidate division WWE3 bacterium RIFCSPLOWO2_01_FULL_53_14 TaxID=1802628 RepID=A0A1F4VRD4_UNCKA|nr:MAG: hypothetical protein A2890_01010 [candidate division WWE3 bacterium RIFCSPLOWO2_01_FULL_53_14]